MLHEQKLENFKYELERFSEGLELAAKSSFKLWFLGFRWMRKQLSSLARLFLEKPKLIRRNGAGYEEVNGANLQNGLHYYQPPPNRNW